MKAFAFLVFLAVLSACTTVNFQPPEGSTSGPPLRLSVADCPRVLTLGTSSLMQIREIDEHSELPFLEDGGTYTTRTGGEYRFADADGHQSTVIIVNDGEFITPPGGKFPTVLTLLSVEIGGAQNRTYRSSVQSSPGSDAFLVLNADTPTLVTLDFHGFSAGRAVVAWNQPTALVFSRDGQTVGFLALAQNPVFYTAKGLYSTPSADLALAVLVAYECLRGCFGPDPIVLPERVD